MAHIWPAIEFRVAVQRMILLVRVVYVVSSCASPLSRGILGSRDDVETSAAKRSPEFARTIGNINATLLPALVGLSLGSLTTFVAALRLAALFGLPDVMRVSISAPGSSRSAPAATWVDDAIAAGPRRTAASSRRALPRSRRTRPGKLLSRKARVRQ